MSQKEKGVAAAGTRNTRTHAHTHHAARPRGAGCSRPRRGRRGRRLRPPRGQGRTLCRRPRLPRRWQRSARWSGVQRRRLRRRRAGRCVWGEEEGRVGLRCWQHGGSCRPRGYTHARPPPSHAQGADAAVVRVGPVPEIHVFLGGWNAATKTKTKKRATSSDGSLLERPSKPSLLSFSSPHPAAFPHANKTMSVCAAPATSPCPPVIETLAEMRAWSRARRAEGKRVGLVPTMVRGRHGA